MALTLEDIPIGFPYAPKPLLKDFFEKLIAENRGVDPYGNKMDCVLFNSQSRGYYVNITLLHVTDDSIIPIETIKL